MGCTASSAAQELSSCTRNKIFSSCGILKTLTFVLSLEEHEEFKLVGIGGEAIRGEEVFCVFFEDSKSQGVTY